MGSVTLVGKLNESFLEKTLDESTNFDKIQKQRGAPSESRFFEKKQNGLVSQEQRKRFQKSFSVVATTTEATIKADKKTSLSNKSAVI